MKYLVIDFETKDPSIALGLGSGWVYDYVYGHEDFKVLGAALLNGDTQETEYTIDVEHIFKQVREADLLVGHNIQYDLGCLLCLGFPVKELRKKNLVDTKIFGKLIDNTLMNYSLDPLSAHFLGKKKAKNLLVEAVWKNDLYPYLKREWKEKLKANKNNEEYIRKRPDDKKLEKWAYSNMDLLQEADYNAVAEYAIIDVVRTNELFAAFTKYGNLEQAIWYSNVVHITMDYRARGIKVDLEYANKAYHKLTPLIAKELQDIYSIAGDCWEEFNINSSKELPQIFDFLEIEYPRTEKGNPSITSKWLESQEHPICKKIVQARKLMKIQGDFIKKIIDMQEYITDPGEKYGRVHPELIIFGAKTGRFSCQCPNIQQIPKRDPEMMALCRGMFVPEEGEKWYSLDYSNQEGRLQVHYAYRLNCEGASLLKELFSKDPDLDMHKEVAALMFNLPLESVTKKQRNHAKIINLGLSYGMGREKLSKNLEVSVDESDYLRDKYNNNAPYLNELNKICIDKLKKVGYIKTIGGRRLRCDPGFEYKALNLLIQGSAADQIIKAMVLAFRRGLPVMCTVHDELNMSGTEEEAKKLQECMLEAFDTEVPNVVEITSGTNWGGVE